MLNHKRKKNFRITLFHSIFIKASSKIPKSSLYQLFLKEKKKEKKHRRITPQNCMEYASTVQYIVGLNQNPKTI